MALSELLSPAGRAALAEVIEHRGGTPAEVLEQAVIEHRDTAMRTRPCASLRLYLCDETVTSAGMDWQGRARLTIATACLVVELVPRAVVPTAVEVDAVERIFDAAGEARAMFRAAYARRRD